MPILTAEDLVLVRSDLFTIRGGAMLPQMEATPLVLPAINLGNKIKTVCTSAS
jgi:hypothetical protein